MSSLAGRIPLPFQGFYSATKFAIEAYTEALRMEVRPFGIVVSMIEPGDFATSFTANRRMTNETIPASPYYASARRAIATMARDEQANQDLSPVIGAVETIPASPYYASARRAIATMARDEQANQDLSPVIGAVETILESRRPALRYPRANAVQRTFNALRPFLPQVLAEYLIRDTYGLK